MRRHLLNISAASLLLFSLSACAKKAETVAETTTSDSLLSSTPVEEPAGNMTPQTDYQSQPQQTPSAPASSTPSRPRTTTPRSNPPASQPAEPVATGTLIAAGTPIEITVTAPISTETANVGDAWTGEVKEAVIVGSDVVIPAGSRVEGVVTSSTPAEKGSRAELDLSVRSVTVDGKSYPVTAGTESIVAGSTRARNLGAIAGATAAGALIGKAVGGSSKGAVIGGLIGAAGSAGAVAKSKGFQVVIKDGTAITFNVSKDIRVRS